MFEANKSLQTRGSTAKGVDEIVINSLDIGIDPNNLEKDGFQDLKLYFGKCNLNDYSWFFKR